MDTLTATSRMQQQTQETLVKTHALLVKHIAHRLLAHLPMSVQLDDLMQAGMMGLLEAAKHYDASKGASFETYASIRIRGYMLDEIRHNDWVPRSVHRNARFISQTLRILENRLGREAKDSEIAAELNLSLNAYHELLKESIGSQLYAFDDLGLNDDVIKGSHTLLPEPCSQALHDDLMEKLTQVIDTLPEKERLIMSLYYEQDLNLKEIGEVLNVSESRISQLLTQALLRIRSRFKE